MSLSVSTTPATLHRYLTEDPAYVSKCYGRKEKLYKIAEAVSVIAACVLIFGVAPAFALGLLGATSLVFKTVSALVCGVGCFQAHHLFSALRTDANYQWFLYLIIGDEMQRVKKGGEEYIRQFFSAEGRSIEQIPLVTKEAIAKTGCDCEHPWEALVPLVARHRLGDAAPEIVKKFLAEAQTEREKLFRTLPENREKNLAKLQMAESRWLRISLYCARQQAECTEFLGLSKA